MVLSSDQKVINRGLEQVSEMSVSGTQKLYAGAILQVVKVGSTELLKPATDGAGVVPAGVCIEQEDNSTGISGDLTARFFKAGSEVALATTGSLTYGLPAYILSDGVVGIAGEATNNIKLGVALEKHETEAGLIWVRIDPV